MKIRNCVFCYPDSQLIVHDRENFFVIADPYPLVKGHIMIVSKKHYGCTAELSSRDMDEFLSLKSIIKSAYKRENIAWTGYEHGRAGSCFSNHCDAECHHMHFHFLPRELRINNTVQESLSGMPMSEWTKLGEWGHAYGNYLLVEDRHDGAFFYPTQRHTVPSHYIRSTAAQALGAEERSNWESYNPQYDVNTLGVERIADYLF